MMQRAAVLFTIIAVLAGAVARADENPTYAGPLSPAEQHFVQSIQADLAKRFATTADAEKAGYFRYTNEDETGAISYANLQWNSTDVKHPSQLWYDKNGRLLGADYSVLAVSSHRPVMFGVNPGRWYLFSDHIHWVGRTAGGAYTYDNYVMPGPFKAAGGDPVHPTAAVLVRMKKVSSESDVAKVFDMPSIWDLIVWVKPNPSGAFAEKNPLVKP